MTSSFFPKKFEKIMLGAPILCHSQKKMQHLCEIILTMEYRMWGCRNSDRACFRYENRACHASRGAKFVGDHGSKTSRAINSATVSRSRIKCSAPPSTITSAARGRLL